MARSDRPVAGPAGSGPALVPPWAAPVAVVALVVGTLLAGWVWHASRLDPFDAWVMRWQELAHSHAGGVAAIVSGTLLPVMLMIMVAGAVFAWLAGRRDAVVLALSAAPATLAAELLLKELVHRQRQGDPDLLFPSGHVAVATAATVTAVLVLRVVPVSPRVAAPRAVVAVSRLVETVHSLTDVVGGGATGLVMTLGAASAISASFRRAHVRASSGASSRSTTRPSPADSSPAVLRRLVEVDDAPVPGAGQSRS